MARALAWGARGRWFKSSQPDNNKKLIILMLNERFIYLGVIISFLGGVSYVIDTIKGKTKPNRISWFFWALAPLIAFAAELEKGIGLTSLLTFIVGFNPLLAFLASFVNKNSYWQLKKSDYLYGSLSLLGLVLWKATGEGNLAIFLSILSDGAAAIPTVVKSFHYPETESGIPFLMSAIASVITLLTINDWSFAHWGFPTYILLICLLLYSLIQFQWGVRLINFCTQKSVE
jgi:hypothetical protein